MISSNLSEGNLLGITRVESYAPVAYNTPASDWKSYKSPKLHSSLLGSSIKHVYMSLLAAKQGKRLVRVLHAKG